jgi:trigger factor
MKTELKQVSPTQKELHIEIPAENVREVYNKVSQKYARAVTVPGFRKGLAPVDVVRVRYKEEIKSEVFRELLPDQVTAAIQENELSPLGEPHLHIEDVENVKVNGSQPISLHVHVEVMPEIAEPKYKGLEATRRIRPVKEEELEKIINERRQQSASLLPVEDRKSKEGDTLIVDLEGIFVDKPEEAPIKAEDLEITIGEAHIEKAFNENLIGLEEDDEKEFTVEYPEDFSSQFLAGQKVNYKAKVKSVGVIEIPAADDEWAQGLEEDFKSMKDLRKKLRDDLEMMAKLEADNKVRDELVTKLIEAHQIEVPNTLIDIQARNLLENFAQDLARQGMDINKLEKDFIQMAYGQMRPQAERDVRGALLLEEVARLEKIEVTGDEIAEEIEKMATYYRVTPEEVRKSLSQQGGENSVADRLRSRKAVEKLVEKAKVTDAEWIDESQPQGEVEEKKTKSKAEKKEKSADPKEKKAGKKKAE